MAKRIYMYDVRGIQNYIYRTNKIQEIIGASRMVRDIIMDTFKNACDEVGVIYKEADDKIQFDFEKPNTNLDAEIMYYGGGNLFVFFEDENKADEVNKLMRINLVKETYSLQLAVASTEITGKDNYVKDIRTLRENMNEEKLNMSSMTPVRAFPITQNDPQTGFPFSEIVNGRMATYETKRKMEQYKESLSDENDEHRILNDYGTELGDSMIAVVHIDGNNMGQYITQEMDEVNDYCEATTKMRELSKNIKEVFIGKALKNVRKKVRGFCDARGVNKKFLPFRTIIAAGDDITFVCNARIVLDCVNEFINSVAAENKKIGSKFSACAGVYVMHSHFPFSRAYELAEQLCASAKAKSRKCSGGNLIAANFVDFQISYTGLLSDIDRVRSRNYVDATGQPLYARPYHLGNNKLTDDMKMNELDDLYKMIDTIRYLPKSKIKSLRESFYDGKEFVDIDIKNINSRVNEDKRIVLNDDKDYQLLFDAIDVMDMKWGALDE